MTYLRYIGPALLTWAKGIRWLWTRQISRWVEIDTHQPPIFVPQLRFQRQHQHGIVLNIEHLIRYKPGWGPWKFLPIYLFDYGLAVLLGYGCISISRHKRLFGKSHWAMTGPRLWGVEGVR